MPIGRQSRGCCLLLSACPGARRGPGASREHGEPPTSQASVSLSSKVDQGQVETSGLVGWSCPCGSVMPFTSHRHLPWGWSPSEVFCALSLSLISVAGGSLPRALAQLMCTILANCCVPCWRAGWGIPCPQMGVAAGLPWTLTTRPCSVAASGCPQILPVPWEQCGSGTESGLWLLTPCHRAAVQCWAGSAAPKTPSE